MAIREQPVGQWLRKFAPKIFELVAEANPEGAAFAIIRNLIKKDDMLTPRQRREGLSVLLENENAAVTERWRTDADATWLTKNVRPLVVLFVVAIFGLLTYLDGTESFTLSDRYFKLWEVAMASVVGGYFGLRSIEKLRR